MHVTLSGSASLVVVMIVLVVGWIFMLVEVFVAVVVVVAVAFAGALGTAGVVDFGVGGGEVGEELVVDRLSPTPMLRVRLNMGGFGGGVMGGECTVLSGSVAYFCSSNFSMVVLSLLVFFALNAEYLRSATEAPFSVFWDFVSVFSSLWCSDVSELAKKMRRFSFNFSIFLRWPMIFKSSK